ncbi:MAG: TolB family protein, partial [Rhodanobacteraceae bacterium]
MNRIAVAGFVWLLVSAGAFAAAPQQDASPATARASTQKLTLEQIMADPDWIGPPVEDPYWSSDGRSIYFKLKRKGSPLHDLYRVPASGGSPVKLSDAELAKADGAAVFDRAHDRAAFLRHGDVFVCDLAGGATRQITRSDAGKSSLQFSADGRLLSWRQGDDWYVWNA